MEIRCPTPSIRAVVADGTSLLRLAISRIQDRIPAVRFACFSIAAHARVLVHFVLWKRTELHAPNQVLRNLEMKFCPGSWLRTSTRGGNE
jgi:hypothetical protein